MKYIYTVLIALSATFGYGYDVLTPNSAQVLLINPSPLPVVTQTMVYQTPYFTVTVPVPVAVPVVVTQPAQHNMYWGYPYTPVPINYYGYQRCRIFNY